MNVKTEINGTSVTAFLSGEIDHHNAPQIREAIDECVAFRQPDRLILDFGDVTFMDSSGIGLVMGRYKMIRLRGGTLKVTNVPDNIFRIMKLSGLGALGVI